MRIAGVLLVVSCCLSAAGGWSPETTPRPVTASRPGFDPQEVIRQVHGHQDMSGLRRDDLGRRPTRLRDRFPDLSELGGEQSLDYGEFLIDTSSTLVPAPGSQNDAAIAFDGANFLVVWEDRRSGNFSDICGARVTPMGTVLDPLGFVVSQAGYDQQYPAVGFDGANFLVVWQDYRRGHAFDIYGARVTPGGAVLDPGGFVINQKTNTQSYPALCFDGANFLVVWQDNDRVLDRPDICGARVTPQGSVLDPSGFVVSQSDSARYAPAVCFDGTNSLVVWQDCRDTATRTRIYGARVTPGGSVLDSSGFSVSRFGGVQGAPVLGFDGANFLVVWQSGYGPPLEYGVYGARVTPGGTVLDPDGFTISQESGIQAAPGIGFDGENFLVVWQDNRAGGYDIYGARVTPGRAVLDPDGLVLGQAVGWQCSPVCGFDGYNCFVVWQDYRDNRALPDMYGARVTPAGLVIDEDGFLISQGTRDQDFPALGFNGTYFLAVWEEQRGGYSDIHGARVTPGGDVRDPAGTIISQAGDDQLYPAVGFDGTNSLVVWQDYRNNPVEPDIYGARVTLGGTVLDPDGIVISQAMDRQFHPALAFNGTNFLVVWQRYFLGDFDFDIYGARVTPGGAVLDPGGFVISHAPHWQTSAALDFDGTNFLVVWQDWRDTTTSHIYGARVTPGGAVLDPDGIVLSQAENGQYAPALAFDGANFLVAWEDYRRSVYSDIYAARVTPGGSVLDPDGFEIVHANNDQFVPAVGFDGENFLVVWEDYRTGSADIYGARVTPAGVVTDSGVVVRQMGSQANPALALGPDSQMFLVYQGWVGTIGNKTYNTDRIWGKMDPNPAVAEMSKPEVRMTSGGATIVRGVLLLPPAPGVKRSASSVLLDISGRKVLVLHAGANDVSALAPGVYFVIEEPQASSRKPQAVRKIIIAE